MKIEEILKKNNIKIVAEDMKWKESVYLASKPLVEQGFVEKRFPDEIIKNTLEFGPYFILTEDVAFLHVRPEQGVISNQIAILLNKKKVYFPGKEKEKAAKLFITLAAKGSDDHVLIMQKIAEILSDEEKIKQILQSESADEIYNLIKD